MALSPAPPPHMTASSSVAETTRAFGEKMHTGSTAAPKLKLTFKLSSIRPPSAAAPLPLLRTKNAHATAKRKRTRRNRGRDAADARENGASAEDRQDAVHPAKSSEHAPAASTSAAIAAADGGAVFVREMQRLVCRRWQWEPKASVAVLPQGRSFHIPCWTRQRLLPPPTLPPPSPAHADAAKASAGSSTFVCPHQGCHKIFDSKDKWRRHQTVHKKRTAKLQLKLHVGSIRANTQQA